MDELKHEIQELIGGVIDFEGQKTSEKAVDVIIYGGAAASLLVGFVTQSFTLTVYGSLGTLIAAIIACFPFPWYRKNELQWLAPVQATTISAADVIVDK